MDQAPKLRGPAVARMRVLVKAGETGVLDCPRGRRYNLNRPSCFLRGPVAQAVRARS